MRRTIKRALYTLLAVVVALLVREGFLLELSRQTTWRAMHESAKHDTPGPVDLRTLPPVTSPSLAAASSQH